VNTQKRKICIITTSLDQGGAERSSAMQSLMFENLGYDVYIVTVLSGVAYKYSGTVFNLGTLKDKNNTMLGRIQRLIAFKKFLSKNKFDIIIDNRPRKQAYIEFIVTKFIYNVPTIYVIHSFEISVAFTPYMWLNKLLYKNEILVAVSKEGANKFKKLYGLKNIHTIYNAFDFKDIYIQSQLDVNDLNLNKYIIYYGRIHDKSKNLKLLLDAYKNSKLNEQDIKLLILGDGEDLKMIKEYSKTLQLDSYIIFKGFVKNPFPYVKNALFTVLSSRSEGFAMVLPESLYLETPVVSVACEAGPKEIIVDGKNGLLTENFNSHELGKAMDRIVFEKELYQRCKFNSRESVEKFSMENIMKDWEKVFDKMNIGQV
jgi:glycosyltransferase involved in cell wall biosynthesis